MNTSLFTVGMYAYAMLFDRWAGYDEATRKYAGRWEILTDNLYVVREVMGQYVKMERISRYTNDVSVKWFNRRFFAPLTVEQLPVAMAKLQLLMERQIAATIADTDYKVRQAQLTADRMAMTNAAALSQNTVTRALCHAADNGYCEETAIALISAGHKLPKIQLMLKVTLTIPIELAGKKDYYAIRDIFGNTRGDMSKLTGETITQDVILNKARAILNAGEASLSYSHYDTDTYPVVDEATVEFGDPVIRPLEDVQQERPVYAGERDSSQYDEDDDRF